MQHAFDTNAPLVVGICRIPPLAATPPPSMKIFGFEPPDEEGERLIDRPEPGRSELRLESQAPGGPFGRRPEKGEHRYRHEEQLAQRILVADMRKVDVRPSNIQRQSARRRDDAHRGVDIGCTEREVALASKTLFNATRTRNAVHLRAKFALHFAKMPMSDIDLIPIRPLRRPGP
jgi:hypothetical protein